MRKPQKPQSGKPVTVGHLNKAPPEYKSTALCYNNPLGVNFWDVTSAPTLWKNLLPPSYSLKMEAACSFKMLANFTRQYCVIDQKKALFFRNSFFFPLANLLIGWYLARLSITYKNCTDITREVSHLFHLLYYPPHLPILLGTATWLLARNYKRNVSN